MSDGELRSSTPVGRKDYRCIWCGQTIPKGERHFYRSHVFEGELSNDRFHMECIKAMQNCPDTAMDGFFYPFENTRPQAFLSESGCEDKS